MGKYNGTKKKKIKIKKFYYIYKYLLMVGDKVTEKIFGTQQRKQ